jgi:MFS family permease
METSPQTSKDFFRTLQIIFLGLIIGQILFGLVSLFLNQTEDWKPVAAELKQVFIYIVPVFVIGGYLGGKMLFKRSMRAAQKKAGLSVKLSDYRSACIVRYALLEGPSMLALISYLITGELSFLVMAAFIIAIFLTIIPTPQKAITDLALDLNDEQKLNNPDAEIK